MDTLVPIANGFFILTYAVKDLLALRVLSFAGACCLAVYFGFRDEPLLNVACWNVFFATLNLFWICRLVLERRGRRDGKTAISSGVAQAAR